MAEKKVSLGHYRGRFGVWHFCEECGARFEATRIDAKCCGPKCRKRLERRMRKVTEAADAERRAAAQLAADRAAAVAQVDEKQQQKPRTPTKKGKR